MTKDEALKLALEALELIGMKNWSLREDKAINAIKEALAQPEPWENFCDSNCVWTDHHPDCRLAERKPLTDEGIEMLWPLRPTDEIVAFARAIEAAHGIKGEA